MTNPQKTYIEIWDFVNQTYDMPLFAAGKSYGGRVGSTIVTQLKHCQGLIFLGYPFHPAKNTEKLRTEHLYNIEQPMLFLQGSRDALSTPEIANDFVNNHTSAELLWLEDGDHSWKPRKKSGFTQEQHMKTAARKILEFCTKHR